MRKMILLFITAASLAACSNNADENKSSKNNYDIDRPLAPSGEKMSVSEKEAKLEMLITESKRTMDSIDVAYKTVRQTSRTGSLSMDERNQVSEALMDLSNARDLIVLEMQESVISELQEKTVALQTVMKDMNVKSDKMLRIATTLSRVSDMIGKTATMLSSAVGIGLIRPPIPVSNTPS